MATISYRSPKGRKISRGVLDSFCDAISCAKKIANRPGVKSVKVWTKSGKVVASVRPSAPESESERDVDSTPDEEWEQQQLLKQVERINQKSGQLREISKSNSERLTRIEEKLKSRRSKSDLLHGGL